MKNDLPHTAIPADGDSPEHQLLGRFVIHTIGKVYRITVKITIPFMFVASSGDKIYNIGDMKGKIVIIIVVSLLFVVFVVTKLVFDVMNKKEGRLRVVTNQEAVFFLDNVMKGKTPFEGGMSKGNYILKIVPEQTATTSSVTWERKVTIEVDTLTFVDVRLATTDIETSAETYWLSKRAGFGIQPAGLVIESEPSGALVYLDGDEKGITPITIDEVTEGSHELAIFMPGFVRKSKKINIVKGSFLHAFMKLPVDPNQAPKYSPIEQPREATSAANIEQPNKTVRILDTPTGWLRVREEPTLAGSESGRVNPGQVFEYLSEQVGWYQIKFETNKVGWISSQYAQKTQ